MTPQIAERFKMLVIQMEPENLYQDGERSRSAAERERRRLRREWGALERAAGRPVTESEIWSLFQ